ncbi:hypothetical protein YK56LOC_18720 [Caballeronia sp. HLA56]
MLIVPEPPHAASVSTLATAAATIDLRKNSCPTFLVFMMALVTLFWLNRGPVTAKGVPTYGRRGSQAFLALREALAKGRFPNEFGVWREIAAASHRVSANGNSDVRNVTNIEPRYDATRYAGPP